MKSLLTFVFIIISSAIFGQSEEKLLNDFLTKNIGKMLQQYETFIEENQTVYNYTEENGEIKPSAVFISFTEEFPLVLISKYKNEIPLSDFLYENKSKQLKFKKIQQINYISSEEGAAALYGSRGAAGVYTLIVK